ncbi:hypothetical protein FRC11_001584, partial [Ceratobasidium sp. 423]
MSENDLESAQNSLSSPEPNDTKSTKPDVLAPEAIRKQVEYYELKGNQTQKDWL